MDGGESVLDESDGEVLVLDPEPPNEVPSLVNVLNLNLNLSLERELLGEGPSLVPERVPGHRLLGHGGSPIRLRTRDPREEESDEPHLTRNEDPQSRPRRHKLNDPRRLPRPLEEREELTGLHRVLPQSQTPIR